MPESPTVSGEAGELQWMDARSVVQAEWRPVHEPDERKQRLEGVRFE